MELLIKSINGTRNLTVNKECSVLDLKKEIKIMHGAFPEEQELQFNDVQLIDDKKLLTSYGIRSNCEINLFINFSEFTVLIQYDETYKINVNRNETVNDLKKKIEKILHKSISEQSLIYNGTTIEDDQKLSTYGLTDKSLIVLIDRVTEDSIINQKYNIQLLVKTFDNKTVAFQISKKLKCIELKKRISSKLGISVESQALSFHDVSLEDEKLLEHYGLAEKSVINLSTRLRGG